MNYVAVIIILFLVISIIMIIAKPKIGFLLMSLQFLFCTVAMVSRVQIDFSFIKVENPTEYQYTFGEDTVEVHDKIVEQVVEVQKAIQLPVFELPKDKTLLLLDKSGSMKELSTKTYLENARYFAGENNVWFFDTEVQKADISQVQFYGDTNITGAVQQAIDAGYKNILLCSDMEQTVPLNPIQGANGVKIFIIAPKAIEEEKKALQMLINTHGIDSIESVTIN